MIYKNFSISESVIFSIKSCLNWRLFLPMVLVGALIGLIPTIFMYYYLPVEVLYDFENFKHIYHFQAYAYFYKLVDFNRIPNVVKLLFLLLLFFLASLYEASLIKVYLLEEDKKKPKFEDFITIDYSILRFIGAKIWYWFVTTIGFILFIVPGLVWLTRYYFAQYIVIDKRFEIEKSFTASSYITWTSKMKIFLFIIILNILFGLFFSVLIDILLAFTLNIYYLMPVISFSLYYPLSVAAKVHAYKQLLKGTPEVT